MQLCLDNCLTGVALERDQEYAGSHNLFDIFDSCVAYTLKLSEKLDERLLFLHAILEPAESSGFSTPHVSMDRVYEEKERTESEVYLYAASQLKDFNNFVTVVGIGAAHTVIARYGEERDIDLIVIRERRKGKLARALSQKTTSKVLESSDRLDLKVLQLSLSQQESLSAIIKEVEKKFCDR